MAARRGLSGPATNRLARKLRTLLCGVRIEVGGEVHVYSASWWTFIDREGLAKGDPRNGWDEVVTQLKDRAIINPGDLYGTRWDFVYSLQRNAERSELT